MSTNTENTTFDDFSKSINLQSEKCANVCIEDWKKNGSTLSFDDYSYRNHFSILTQTDYETLLQLVNQFEKLGKITNKLLDTRITLGIRHAKIEDYGEGSSAQYTDALPKGQLRYTIVFTNVEKNL